MSQSKLVKPAYRHSARAFSAANARLPSSRRSPIAASASSSSIMSRSRARSYQGRNRRHILNLPRLRPHDSRDSLHKLLPIGALTPQLLFSRRRQPVELGLPIELGNGPIGSDP